jgi:hypothetical protein
MIQNSLFRFNRNHLKNSSVNLGMSNRKTYPLKNVILVDGDNTEQETNQNRSLPWLPKYHPLIPLIGFIISSVSFIIGIDKSVRFLPIDPPFIISSAISIAFQLLNILIFHCFNCTYAIQAYRSFSTSCCTPIWISYIGFIISTISSSFQIFPWFSIPIEDGKYAFGSILGFICILGHICILSYYTSMIVICIGALRITISNHLINFLMKGKSHDLYSFLFFNLSNFI